MKRMFAWTGWAGVVAAGAGVILATGCVKRELPDMGVRTAIVPGADLLVDCDFATLRTAPIRATLKGLQGGPAAADAGAPGLMDKILAAAGLVDTNLVMMLVSADLDGCDLNSPKPQEELRKAPAVVALGLNKAIATNNLLAAVRVLTEERKGAQLTETRIGQTFALKLTPSSPKEPPMFAALSHSGKTVFMAFNEASLAAALLRDAAGQAEAPHPEFASLNAAMPAGAQIRVLLLASEPMRAKLRQNFASMQQQANVKASPLSMALTFLGPVQNMQDCSIALKLTEDAEFAAVAKLSNASEAQQCAHLANAFIVPMLRKGFEQSPQLKEVKAIDSLAIRSDGLAFRIGFKVTARDIEIWNKMPAPAAPAVKR